MNKPIFIIGCPRSGTTLTLRTMAIHEELAWVSNYVNLFPNNIYFTIFNRIYNISLLGKYLYKNINQRQRTSFDNLKEIVSSPVEPWRFWNNYLQKFQWQRQGNINPRRRYTTDLKSGEIERIRNVVGKMIKLQGKTRFLSKYTDFPRIQYLSKAFPDAKFIHVLRSGYAVAASYTRKMEKQKFNTWDEREWWISGWPAEWQKEWKSKFNTPHTLSAYQWKYFVSEIFKDAENISQDRYYEVNYNDIVSQPINTFNRLFEFCELKKSKRVEWYLNAIQIQNMNGKWKQYFMEEEIKDLNYIFDGINMERVESKMLN